MEENKHSSWYVFAYFDLILIWAVDPPANSAHQPLYKPGCKRRAAAVYVSMFATI